MNRWKKLQWNLLERMILKMADLDQAVRDLAQSVQDVGTRVARDIAALKDELVNATGVSDKAQAAADSIEAQAALLSQIDPAAPVVATPEPEAPAAPSTDSITTNQTFYSPPAPSDNG